MEKRNSTTEFLKDCIADSLLLLLQEKPIEKITIQELTAKASVGRVTYYRNFTSKEDIITYKLDKLMDTWFSTNLNASLSPHTLAVSFFRFFYTIRDTIHTLMKANLSDIFMIQMTRKFTTLENYNTADIYRQVFLSFGLCGIIQTWITTGMQESPEEMVNMLAQT